MRRTGRDQVRRRGSTEGKQSNEEIWKSSEEAGKKLAKTGNDRGGRRPPRPPSRREQERNQQVWEGPGRKGDGPWKYRGGAGKKQGRTGKEAARIGKDLGTTGWENRRREESGRELATKTEPEKIREGMGDKRGRIMGKTEEEPARIGNGEETTLKGRGRTSEMSYIMQRTGSIQFGSTYMQQCIYYFMLSVSVLDQVCSPFLLASWCAFWCLLGATWMQKTFKRGPRITLLDNKS